MGWASKDRKCRGKKRSSNWLLKGPFRDEQGNFWKESQVLNTVTLGSFTCSKRTLSRGVRKVKNRDSAKHGDQLRETFT